MGKNELTLRHLTVKGFGIRHIRFDQTTLDTASQVNAITAKLHTNFKKRRTQEHQPVMMIKKKDMFASVWTAFHNAVENCYDCDGTGNKRQEGPKRKSNNPYTGPGKCKTCGGRGTPWYTPHPDTLPPYSD